MMAILLVYNRKIASAVTQNLAIKEYLKTVANVDLITSTHLLPSHLRITKKGTVSWNHTTHCGGDHQLPSTESITIWEMGFWTSLRGITLTVSPEMGRPITIDGTISPGCDPGLTNRGE